VRHSGRSNSDFLGRAFAAQEALAAKDRAALRGLEGHRGFAAALGAHGRGFGLALSTNAASLALILTGLAALGFVLEVLVVEEVLFSRREYELCSAVYALEAAILELRHNSPIPVSTWIVADSVAAGLAPRRRVSLCLPA